MKRFLIAIIFVLLVIIALPTTVCARAATCGKEALYATIYNDGRVQLSWGDIGPGIFCVTMDTQDFYKTAFAQYLQSLGFVGICKGACDEDGRALIWEIRLAGGGGGGGGGDV